MDSWINNKIKVLDQLKTKIIDLAVDTEFLYQVEANNPWFTMDFVKYAIQTLAHEMLDSKKLSQWITPYSATTNSKNLGIILAGNIPLVGFHDLLCAYMSPHIVKIKLSSKDIILTKKIIEIWSSLDSEWASRISIVEKIDQCEKIIATGSANTYRYFEAYFKKYEHILRKNRTSIALVPANISDAELDLLMDDIFLYFGLGCRNVSLLWIEKGFQINRIFEASERYAHFFSHSKYMNNYDYQRTLLLLNRVIHLANNFLMLRENESIFSPISVVHYQEFEQMDKVHQFIAANHQDIQCVIGPGFITYGSSQQPGLNDYADGVNVMEFLSR